MRLLATALLLATAATAQTQKTQPHLTTPKPKPIDPTGPTILLDTTLGRITCRLYDKEAPATTANFLTQIKASFYDGSLLNGVSDGVLAGAFRGPDKLSAGDPFPADHNPLTFDRPGRLVMTKPTADPGAPPLGSVTSRSIFLLLEHADMEYEKRGATIFGQCTDDSLPIITAISHAMLTVDNRPTTALTLDHITLLNPGDPTPAAPPAPKPEAATLTPAPQPPSTPPAPEPTGPTATIETTAGTLTCQLFKETPIATANFIGLATGTKDWHLPTTQALQHNKRFYDGLGFGRVIPDFMIQQSEMPSDRSGDGSLGYHFANEIVPGLTFDRPGRLAYANAGPNTNASEWFITEHPVHRLDGRFTIFGQCDEPSVTTSTAIARTPRDEHNRPLTPVTIKHITIK